MWVVVLIKVFPYESDEIGDVIGPFESEVEASDYGRTLGGAYELRPVTHPT